MTILPNSANVPGSFTQSVNFSQLFFLGHLVLKSAPYFSYLAEKSAVWQQCHRVGLAALEPGRPVVDGCSRRLQTLSSSWFGAVPKYSTQEVTSRCTGRTLNMAAVRLYTALQ